MKIQRRFLYGGVKGDSKFAWVRWEDVCNLKKVGGIVVYDLRMVKWMWRLLLGATDI